MWRSMRDSAPTRPLLQAIVRIPRPRDFTSRGDNWRPALNTPIARNTMSLPAQRTSEVHAHPPDAARTGVKDAENADAGAQAPSSPVGRKTALARVPRGPFKTMTIPQAWYDSLHAAPAVVGGAENESGEHVLSVEDRGQPLLAGTQWKQQPGDSPGAAGHGRRCDARGKARPRPGAAQNRIKSFVESD